jgi:SAM-dependent methyltransferase
LSGGAEFRCSTLDECREESARPFAVVTAFDVIEHVADPAAFLRSAASVLQPGGFLFVSTPDVDSLTATIFGRRWHFYHPYHLSYFGPRTLVRAAAGSGLEMLDCRHRGRRRSLGYVVRYFAEFIVGVHAPGWARRLDRWSIPINLFDTMYCAFKLSGTNAPQRRTAVGAEEQ